MLSDVPKNLQSFFMPQVEQLGLSSADSSLGYRALRSGNEIRGALWSFLLMEGCLVTCHDISVGVSQPLEETVPFDYACLCSESFDCLSITPIPKQHTARPQENLVSFAQAKGSYRYGLAQGVYASRSICFTPRFFETHRDLWPYGFERFCLEASRMVPNTLTKEIRLAMRPLTLAAAQSDAAVRATIRMLQDAVRLLMHETLLSTEARTHRDSTQQRLVGQAKRLIANNLDAPFLLDNLAANLFVSKSMLCAVFRQETGMSIGEYMQAERLRTAKDLLIHSKRDIAEIARLVGYRRQGSFTDMFKTQTGSTPTYYRCRHSSSASE